MGFTPAAKWKVLTLEEQAVVEPRDKTSKLLGPIVPDGKKEFQKFNFPDIFDHPPVTTTSPVFELSTGKKIVKDRRTGAPKYIPQVRDEGRANVNWLKKH